MPPVSFMLLSAVTFLSAFLLFQIELIIAKMFLPAYGGSYLVWGACVVFFQFVLLAGYVFAHMLITRMGIRNYLTLHMVLLFLPFFFFPGRTIQVNGPAGSLPLMLDIFVRLLISIGPVFFVCSTVSLVTQAWLAASTAGQRKHPYSLYAVSNIGSFAALWSYPFLVEYFLTNSQQINIWRALYVVLALLTVWAVRCVPVTGESASRQEDGDRVARTTLLRWFLLSAGAVIMFLSVTNIITYEVAPIPLLWIIPLSIYLLSFILCFKERPWYPRWMKGAVVFSLIACAAAYFRVKFALLPGTLAVLVFNAALFCICMHLQHELIRTKPRPGQMTLFYVMISLGGFCGGLFTSWIVPLISNSSVELLYGLALVAVTFPSAGWRIVFVAGAVMAFAFNATDKIKPHLLKHRNFYGIYEVAVKNGVRTFAHGTTLHGLELEAPEKRFIPLGYYSPLTPLGEVFRENIFAAERVGAIGLGVGTVAIYSGPNMVMDFYELDPDVEKIARAYFWYLGLAPGPVNVVLGDARISLAKAEDKIYDIMIIDAFGGDSVPVHLINKDVVGLYRQRLSPRGGLLFHIPSRYFNLKPVLANIAREAGAFALVKDAVQDSLSMRTCWAVLTWDKERADVLAGHGWTPLLPEQYKPLRTWTDDYSTTLPVLQLTEFWYYVNTARTTIKQFFTPKH